MSGYGAIIGRWRSVFLLEILEGCSLLFPTNLQRVMLRGGVLRCDFERILLCTGVSLLNFFEHTGGGLPLASCFHIKSARFLAFS